MTLRGNIDIQIIHGDQRQLHRCNGEIWMGTLFNTNWDIKIYLSKARCIFYKKFGNLKNDFLKES